MTKYYCKYCGAWYSKIEVLKRSPCGRHPDGPGKGMCVLYHGKEKAQYTCKYCGMRANSIASLTHTVCARHPYGPGKGRHSPAM